ncbi:MAG: MBL fold metallo-hydrolase RNA specificity domain-containing protein, partial [Candidatus Woesearchaeota archaeon]
KAKDMLFDVFKNIDVTNRAIIITTFSSHIARLQSIIDLAKKLDRRVVFVGRSLAKYIECAKKAGICDYEQEGEIISSKKNMREKFKEISANKRDYVIVCTGHQGEENSVVWKLVHKDIKFNFQANDIVVFSSNIIPTVYNKKLREDIEQKLLDMRIKVIKDVHVSGHLAGRDYKDVLKMLKPKLLIPTHGDEEMSVSLMKIAENIDIKTLRCHDGQKYILD